MAAITFPSSPSNNQVHTVGDRSWKYNGVAWKLVARTTDAIVEGSTNLYFTNTRVASAPAVTSLESRATAIEADITAIESAATSLASRVGTAEGEIDSLQSGLATAQTDILAVGVRVDNVLSNVDGAALDSLTEVVAAFQAADSNLNGAISSLAGAASSALAAETTARESADSALDSRLDTAESDIDSLEGRASSIESAATTLAGRVSTAESDINAIESAATTLAGRVTTAETDIIGLESSKQIKNVVSITAPSHAAGLRWVDPTDMSEYLSYNSAWVELDKQ